MRKAAVKDPFLVAMGERVRMLRARRGLSRRVLAREAQVSERHLANLETGVGNASVLVLRQIAAALGCALAEMVGGDADVSAEWRLIRDLLDGLDDSDLKRARLALFELLAKQRGGDRKRRIALVGLRGAGKSTLGRMLAGDVGLPFVELNGEIERIAGCSVGEVHALYGPSAYRRYERRALDQVVRTHASAVIATPGGLVSEPATFNVLLANCFTVWLHATPEEHMHRVIEQGDLRPMSGNREAMDDLKRILAGRIPFYAKADLAYSTAEKTLPESYSGLRAALNGVLPATQTA